MANLSTRDVAKKFNITTRTVFKYVAQGIMPGYKLNGKWIFDEEELEKWHKARQAGNVNALEAEDDSDELNSESTSTSALLKEIQNAEDALSNLGDLAMKVHKSTNNIMEGTSASGITSILKPRRFGEQGIGDILKNATGEILLCGIALRQFFHDKTYRALIWEKLSKDVGVDIKVLLLNPLSRAAKARLVAEEATSTKFQPKGKEFERSKSIKNTTLFLDIQRSLTTIHQLKDHAKKGNWIDVKFYDCNPFAFILCTQDAVLTEQYHWGRDQSAVYGGCIGELMPITNFVPTSEPGQLMRRSFFHLWNNENFFVGIKSLDEIEASIKRVK